MTASWIGGADGIVGEHVPPRTQLDSRPNPQGRGGLHLVLGELNRGLMGGVERSQLGGAVHAHAHASLPGLPRAGGGQEP